MSETLTELRTPDPLRNYHIGCGPMIAEGFINIDESFGPYGNEMQHGVLYRVSDVPHSYILRHDLRKGIPAGPQSLDVIYHSHFLEHLTREDGSEFIRKCHVCLVPGGTMRIALPDLALWCRHYINGDKPFFDWYKNTYLRRNGDMYQTHAQIFMGMIYNHGHCMAYDYETLELILKDAGFVNIHKCEWGDSDRIATIAHLEGTGADVPSQRRFESLVVECERGI